MTDVTIDHCSPETLFYSYNRLSPKELLLEYNVIQSCSSILWADNLYNSYVLEIVDACLTIMRDVMAERYIASIESAPNVVPLKKR